jgi:hypothetical protein
MSSNTPSLRGWSTHRFIGLALAATLATGAIPHVAAAADASDPDESPAAQDETGADMGTLTLSLPIRPGPAPSVTTGVPHIQMDQTSEPEIHEALATWAFSLPSVAERPSSASLPGARALTLAEDLPANDAAMIVGREFAHIHANPGAGSLHLRLPAEAAGEVVASGWGEWHPFALDGSMPGLVMVYAPRDIVDLEAVQLIIGASVDHATSSVTQD